MIAGNTEDYKMKYAAICLMLVLTSYVDAAWINEFHYDNTGGDVGEFIEIVVPTNSDPSDFSVRLYNGDDQELYNSGSTVSFSGAPSATVNGFDIYFTSLPNDGLQNGAPDGMALLANGVVLEFLSYEGSFTASGGPADGLTSTDIGVEESGSTPVNFSLQLLGTGNTAGDFEWTGPFEATPGALNEGFLNGSSSTQSITAVPDPSSATFALIGGAIACTRRARRRS